jgi:hypothetical protein
MIHRLLRRCRKQDGGHASQPTADRSAVTAVTARALAGHGGMPGLLWSQVWLTEALTVGENSPDEASFADTIPLAEIRPAYDSRSATMRFRDAFVPGDRAA